MFGQQPGELYRLRSQSSAPLAALHNVPRPVLQLKPDGSLTTGEEPISTAATTTAVPSPEDSSASAVDGTWGERDVGGPVSHRMAMDDYESMRRELSQLSQIQSKGSTKTGGMALFRSQTSQSRKSKRSQTSTSLARRPSSESTQAEDLEAGDAEIMAEKEDEFELGRFIKEGHFERRTEEGQSAKKVGVIFKNLTVKGTGTTTNFAKTLPDAILGTFGPDLYRIVSGFVPLLQRHNAGATRTLINDFTGVVRDGEMMLVLGRPGSGCTSFLKALANKRSEYASVTGNVTYGGISAAEQHKRYRGEVNYNPEDDQHFPSLNVWQTLKFSLMNKTKKRHHSEMGIIIEALLKMFGISHTKKTLVGNEYVRGISGGERKRVSIAETLATKSTVVCWDNSTRGLDASTALDYANSLRIMTDVSDRTTLVTLYQAGEGIYELMDKVLVIDEGRMMYQGPASEAKQYFINLGFHCPHRQTTADFLTSVTDPNQRLLRDGYELSAPKTAAEFEQAFRQSEAYKKLLADVTDYEGYLHQTGHGDAKQFKQSVQDQKSKTVSKKSSFTVSFWRQILACTAREFWLVWGDKPTLYTKFFIIVSNGLIVGSLFYNQPNTTEGAFTRGGTLFFSILFLGWLQLTELMKAVSGRVVIARHKDYAFYRPSAVSLARVLADFPLILAQVIIFGTIMYFMTNLDVDVSKFFIYELFVYITTICITALYRFFAALSPTIDDAVRFSGTALNLLIIYTGYVIVKPQLLGEKIWFGWLYYVNPISYAFEGVLTSEFAGRVMECAPSQLIPQGPGIEPPYQGCAVSGGQRGATSVTGEEYLGTTYEYTRSNLWRNFGVVIAFTVLYILVTVIGAELFQFVGGGGGATTFKKSAKKHDTPGSKIADAEKGGESGDSSASSGQLSNEKGEQSVPQTAQSDEIFTWTNVEYSVPYEGSQLKLLNKVHGYAKPGVMVALMGASGAGKTTLLNTLSQRQTVGVVSGDMLVDGKPLGKEFQRITGFVEQQDIHDGTATIREAIEFSAILRQERHIPTADKMAYVEEIIELLELGELQDALISSLGVEQRKRVTIGVKLAAKPSLLFLDEPTSGLDSQSAYSVIRFLRKLAHAGHGLICTIHQPSSLLIQQFDMILALNPEGNTFYFGPVGDNGAAVNGYFSRRGVVCPPEKNIAEFILETAIKGGKRSDGKRLDWNKEWRESQENKDLLAEIHRIESERAKLPAKETTQYEYASPVWLQMTTLTKRMFTQHWRDPSYYYGKLFVAVIMGIFNGFTFYALGNTVLNLQNRMFTAFLVCLIPPTVVNAVVPKFYQNLALWMARENPSRIYNWFAFCTATVVTEIPISIVSALVYWLLWYYPTGLPRDSSTAGYTFFMTMLFFLFQASWGQWICAFAPSFTVISNVLPFFFVMFSLFNGVVRPYSQLDVFWKYWMYYLNPSTYWIGGLMAATLPTIQVQCAPQEAAYFDPPPGQTCSQYARDFVTQAARGYLLDPDATTACGYCPYRTGVEYMATLNVVPSDKWKYLAIFLAFCISNWALVYFFIWTVRVKGWSFGLGYLFGGLGKGVEAMKRGVKKMLAGGKQGRGNENGNR
ncbi:ATP-binding cassette transporter snq2 [Xanthoria calcicola]